MKYWMNQIKEQANLLVIVFEASNLDKAYLGFYQQSSAWEEYSSYIL